MTDTKYPSWVDAKISFNTSQATAKCRLCNVNIDRGEMRFVLKEVHVSPKIKDLHFHSECMERISKFVLASVATETDLQGFRKHLEYAKGIVEGFPVWKQNLLGTRVNKERENND